jgi:hypothetical protein
VEWPHADVCGERDVVLGVPVEAVYYEFEIDRIEDMVDHRHNLK